MNIREMHIEIGQGTQNIAANVTRKLSAEQIDWMLNKNVERFIQSKVKPRADGSGGFQIEQVNADAIRTLLSSREYPVMVDGDGYTAQLPDDYAYLLSDDSKVIDLCGNAAPALSAVTEDILKIQFKSTAAVSPNCYAAVSITFGATTLTLSQINTAYSGTYTGLKSPDEKYVVINTLLWYIRNVLKREVYWESYKTVVALQSFIFPGETAGSITIDTVTTAGTTQSIAYSKYTDEGSSWIPNRLTPTTVISTLQVTPFYKSSINSVISELQSNSLKTYADTSFIISRVRMNYIKKFKRMHLVLSQDCDLPEEFHQTICDLTVEYFKALTQDPNWEVKLKDNMLRSPSTT
jgi:hypothetical protein